MRLIPPVAFIERWTPAPTALGGVELGRGEFVGVSTLAANRDPEVFEDPLRFDVRRENARHHLAFSFGVHHCLGFNMARLQGPIAVQGDPRAPARARSSSTRPSRTASRSGGRPSFGCAGAHRIERWAIMLVALELDHVLIAVADLAAAARGDRSAARPGFDRGRPSPRLGHGEQDRAARRGLPRAGRGRRRGRGRAEPVRTLGRGSASLAPPAARLGGPHA